MLGEQWTRGTEERTNGPVNTGNLYREKVTQVKFLKLKAMSNATRMNKTEGTFVLRRDRTEKNVARVHCRRSDSKKFLKNDFNGIFEMGDILTGEIEKSMRESV